MCVYLKLTNLSICVLLCMQRLCSDLRVFFLHLSVCVRVHTSLSCVYACVRYEQSVSFPAAQPTNHIPPSSFFITYSWVSVSAGRWLALNEQLTALSLNQCYGNKISQSVQQKKRQQSTTGTETLFNPSSETVSPQGGWHIGYCWLHGTFDMTLVSLQTST